MVYEDYARVLDNNSSEAVYSNQNSNMDARPIQTKGTNSLLDSNKLDINNEVNNYEIFLIIKTIAVNSRQYIWGAKKIFFLQK
jgi:hypothetical protein